MKPYRLNLSGLACLDEIADTGGMLLRTTTTEIPLASTFFGSPGRKAGDVENASKTHGSYYLTDHLGSTRAVTDQSGNVLETFDYYPFGLLMPKRSSTAGNTREKFTGKERDGAIGLDYFGARYYDAALGRWHSTDPLASKYPSLSPYNYVANNPFNAFDPGGRLIIFVNGFPFSGDVGRSYWNGF